MPQNLAKRGFYAASFSSRLYQMLPKNGHGNGYRARSKTASKMRPLQRYLLDTIGSKFSLWHAAKHPLSMLQQLQEIVPHFSNCRQQLHSRIYTSGMRKRIRNSIKTWLTNISIG
ncbi:MAG TPA: hypothetical protein VHK86_07130 [Nitrososphaera sp.]|jgi:hypothetical protein|nr:hypothetical protein [Nitrososphaera sp.]